MTDVLHTALSGVFLPLTASVVVALVVLAWGWFRGVLGEEPATDVKTSCDEWQQWRDVLGGER